MTNKDRFTEEQIRDAMTKARATVSMTVYDTPKNGDIIDVAAMLQQAVIAELNRPAVEFEGEEVMVTETRGGNRFYRWREIAHLPPDSYMQKANRRKLTTKEAGAQGIIHGLEEMIRKLYPTHKGICEVGQKALGKWRQERGE